MCIDAGERVPDEDWAPLVSQEMILYLQKLPTGHWSEKEVESVLSRAYMWRASFDQAKSHLSHQ